MQEHTRDTRDTNQATSNQAKINKNQIESEMSRSVSSLPSLARTHHTAPIDE